MLTAIYSLFTSSIGKYIGYGLIVLAVVVLAYGYVKSKENAAIASATATYNEQQLKVALQQNLTYQQEIADLNNYTQSLSSQITDLQTKIEKTTQEAQTVIQNSKDGTTLDPIFPEILKSLKGLK